LYGSAFKASKSLRDAAAAAEATTTLAVVYSTSADSGTSSAFPDLELPVAYPTEAHHRHSQAPQSRSITSPNFYSLLRGTPKRADVPVIGISVVAVTQLARRRSVLEVAVTVNIGYIFHGLSFVSLHPTVCDDVTSRKKLLFWVPLRSFTDQSSGALGRQSLA